VTASCPLQLRIVVIEYKICNSCRLSSTRGATFQFLFFLEFVLLCTQGLEKYGSDRGIIDDKFVEKYPFRENEADRAVFLEFALQLMLFQPPGRTETGQPVAPPGLSLKQAGRVAGKEPLAGEALGLQKVGAKEGAGPRIGRFDLQKLDHITNCGGDRIVQAQVLT
jgi:hypothetical protein